MWFKNQTPSPPTLSTSPIGVEEEQNYYHHKFSHAEGIKKELGVGGRIERKKRILTVLAHIRNSQTLVCIRIT